MESKAQSKVESKDLRKFATVLDFDCRRLIWLATLEPRIVEILTSYRDDADFTLYSQCPLPAALSICQESRAAVLPHYPFSFGCHIQQPRIRLNLEIDTLFVDWWQEMLGFPLLITVLKEDEVNRIRYLAMDDMYAHHGSERPTKNRLVKFLEALTRLELIMYVNDVEDGWNPPNWRRSQVLLLEDIAKSEAKREKDKRETGKKPAWEDEIVKVLRLNGVRVKCMVGYRVQEEYDYYWYVSSDPEVAKIVHSMP
jgi:hypothetical protein